MKRANSSIKIVHTLRNGKLQTPNRNSALRLKLAKVNKSRKLSGAKQSIRLVLRYRNACA